MAGLLGKEAFQLVEGCYNDKPPACTAACPFHLNVKAITKKARRGSWTAAYRELQMAVIFPAAVHALCPRPCEGACQRRTVLAEEPVAIGLLEAACIAYAKKIEPPSFEIPQKEKKVAVIGAGPVGLSFAYRLSRKRFSVTVFDQNESWGGRLRMDSGFERFHREFEALFQTLNTVFCFGRKISGLAALSEFDAVFVATGSGGEDFGLLSGLNRTVFSTSDPRVFMGGELIGQTAIEGMGTAMTASLAAEAYLLSGTPLFHQTNRDRIYAQGGFPHPGEPKKARVLAAEDAMTAEDAALEAERCMQCDCALCMDSCELLAAYRKKPPRIAVDVHQDGQAGRNSVSRAAITRQTWSCNLCGRCAARCINAVDIGALFQLSRSNAVRTGNYIPAFQDYWLRRFSFLSGEAAYVSGSGEKNCEYLFFPGCGLEELSSEAVIRSYDAICDRTDHAAIVLNCCGIPLYWAGEDEKFLAHLRQLKETWESLGRPTAVLACASCAKVFRQYLREIPTISLYQFLAEHGFEKPEAPAVKAAAVFDPCAARDSRTWKDSVRQLAELCGVTLADYSSDGKCCGYGGHIQASNPALFQEIAKNRSQESDAPYVVYCANCRDVFRRQGKPCVHILELLFGIEASGAVSLEEKRESCLKIKRHMVKKASNMEFCPRERDGSRLRVSVPDSVLHRMDEQLMTLGDVKEAIFRAEQDEDGFINQEGETLCHMVKPLITYWVLYRTETVESGDRFYRVIDAYSHRMHVRERERGAR